MGVRVTGWASAESVAELTAPTRQHMPSLLALGGANLSMRQEEAHVDGAMPYCAVLHPS